MSLYDRKPVPRRDMFLNEVEVCIEEDEPDENQEIVFGVELRKFRLRAGKLIRVVADLAKISISQYTSMERGGVIPSQARLREVAYALGLTKDELKYLSQVATRQRKTVTFYTGSLTLPAVQLLELLSSGEKIPHRFWVKALDLAKDMDMVPRELKRRA